MMVSMSNDFVSDGSVIRGRNDNCRVSVVPPKWKPRKVSAIRSFPPGCGPIVNVVSPEADIDNNNINGTEDVGMSSSTLVESLPHDESKTTQIVEEILVNKELQNGEDNGPVNAVVDHGKENGICVIEEAVKKINFSRRRVSAIREFPPFCGLNATEPTEEERKKINGNLKTMENQETGARSKGKEVISTVEDDIIRQVCQEIVVYKRDKVKHSVSEDSEEEFQDEEDHGTQEIVVSPISEQQPRKNIKDIKLELDKMGYEKRLKKRMLDDTNTSGSKEERLKFVLCMFAPSHCPYKFQEQKLIANVDDDISKGKTMVCASTTPKKSLKKKSIKKKSIKKDEEASSSGKKVGYTGTLEMVVRDVDDFPVAPDEQVEEEEEDEKEEEEDFPVSRGTKDVDVVLPPFGPNGSNGVRNNVRQILRIFHALCRKILQAEEARIRQGDESKKGRIDYMAKTELEKKGTALKRGKKTWGAIPGVEVGDEFQYRVELYLVGLHWTLQSGIDYIRKGKDLVAVSVVASGGYDNQVGKPDCLIYSGSGGIGKDKTVFDQKLEKGNLALKNNIETRIPVRVIRGSKAKPVPESSDPRLRPMTAMSYIYDGLYTVDKYYQVTGPRGNLVYKFELTRIAGQPELALREVKSKKFKKTRKGVCVDDIAGGQEMLPISAINTIDDEKPPAFTYITKIIYPDWYNPVPPKGCDCVGRCSQKKCSCASKNDGEIPYNHNGAIVEAKQLVYECGPSCRCPPSCYNRVTQYGMKIELEIFKTESRGWGVRSLSSISSGSFICEYIGELLEDTEAEKRTGNDEYLFDIGQNYNDCYLNPEAKPILEEIVDGGGFTIDAANCGNVGRFINHSCSPNLYAQNVLYDQEDRRMPHIMFFAAENIPPLQELTYHYNYQVGTVHDSDGNVKVKNCYCGSSECSGRLY